MPTKKKVSVSPKGKAGASEEAIHDGHLHTDVDTKKLSDEIFEAVESNSAELSESYLKELHPDELIEILDFIDEEDEKEKYDTVQRVLHRKKIEPIERGRIDERAWAYFYDKYLLRFVLLFWAVFGFTVLKGAIPGKIVTGPNKSIDTFLVVTLAGAAVLILVWRLLYAYIESKVPEGSKGSSIVRKKMGLRVLNEDGTPPGVLKSFLRGLFKMFPFSFITLLTMEISSTNRGLHDRVFKTYVLRINSSKLNSQDFAEFIRRNY